MGDVIFTYKLVASKQGNVFNINFSSNCYQSITIFICGAISAKSVITLINEMSLTSGKRFQTQLICAHIDKIRCIFMKRVVRAWNNVPDE
jgi:hypothetical protein